MTETSSPPFLIVNPNAGGKRLGARWNDAIRPLLKARLGHFSFAFTSRPGEARDIARQALSEGHHKIIVLGGDGTLNEAVNGFMDTPTEIRTRSALGLLPFGSGGDFARTAKIPRRLKQSLAALCQSKIRPIDLGQASFDDTAIAPRYFHNIANAGVVANVMQNVNPMPRSYPALVRYLWGTVKGFQSYQDTAVDIEVDGVSRTLPDVTDVLVANGRYFGRGMQPAPHALLDDGLFDVVILKGASLSRFLRFLPRLYAGDLPASSPIHEAFRCHTLCVRTQTGAAPLNIEMDGENHGHSGVTFSILPKALHFLLPH